MGQRTASAYRRARGGGVILSLAVLLHSCVVLVAPAARSVTRRARRSEDGVVAEYVAMGAFGVVTAVALWALMKALGVDVIDMMRENILGES